MISKPRNYNPMNQQALNNFADQTSLLPKVVAETCINQRNHNLSTEQQLWFINHTESRTVNLYQNNRDWKKSCLKSTGREFLYMFVNHWLDAFIKNPTLYQNKHS